MSPAGPPDHLRALELEIRELRDTVIGHGIRMENGVKVFAQVDTRLQALENLVTPKPVSPMRLIGLVLAICVAAGGALWGLNEKLANRPTAEQMEKLLNRHSQDGHPDLHTEQVRQRAILENLQEKTAGQERKLDELLSRVPKPRDRR